MKRLCLMLLCLLLIAGSVIAASPATPTDLYTIEDDDWGEVNITFERKVFISIDKAPQFLGDTMVLIAILIDFQPHDKYTLEWQYSIDKINWFNVDNEHELIFTTIINSDNCNNWWRVIVYLEECER